MRHGRVSGGMAVASFPFPLPENLHPSQIRVIFAEDSRRVCRWPPCQRKVRATQGAMLPNGKLSARANVHRRKQPPVLRVRVRRRGKSPPVPSATAEAVCVMGCKIIYTDLGRPVRMSGGRLLEAYGDISPRLMTNVRFRGYRTRLIRLLFFLFFFSEGGAAVIARKGFPSAVNPLFE